MLEQLRHSPAGEIKGLIASRALKFAAEAECSWAAPGAWRLGFCQVSCDYAVRWQRASRSDQRGNLRIPETNLRVWKDVVRQFAAAGQPLCAASGPAVQAVNFTWANQIIQHCGNSCAHKWHELPQIQKCFTRFPLLYEVFV
jgi:hypothetical protein